MHHRSLFKNVVIYFLLVAGSILFSLPFVWLACSSVKVDRELFTKELQLSPIAPRPSIRSPYIDDRYYEGDGSRKEAQLLPDLVLLVKETGARLPDDLDGEAATEQIARGLYQKLSRILPLQVWDGPAPDILKAARGVVDQRMVAEVLAAIHRRLCFGQIRARSKAMEEVELDTGLPMNGRLEILTPEVAALRGQTDDTLRFASVNYDFNRGGSVIMSKTFELPFDASQLQRIQLYLRPDDSWHELRLSVEKLGARYESERPLPLGNFNWTVVTWKEEEAEDYPTKIKTWIPLREVERGPALLREPRQIKLTFELRRSGSWRAWWNKLRLNYDRVLSHIPFWRYVCTSLFLVVTNIVLTVFSCSLVAYAFARLQWPGRDFCFLLMLATMMIPGQVTMIPHFLIWKNLGAYNTLTPLWLGHAFGSAFYIFLLRQFLKGIPRDLEDAARIDGCGFFRIYWHIMLPLIKPSLAAIAIFTFMATWNDFMGPLIYVADQRLYPLAFGLYAFSVQVGNNPALTMAASLLMTLPVIVIFFFAQKYFIQGVTLTGMKG